MQNIPRIDREDTSSQRHTRSISMTEVQRPNDLGVPLKIGKVISTPFRIYTDDVPILINRL